MAPDARVLIRELYAAGLLAVEPRRAVREHLRIDHGSMQVSGQRVPLPDTGVVVLSIGKAAEALAHGAVDVLGARVRAGIILTKDGHGANAPAGMRVYEAAHPVPDERGVAATGQIINLVDSLGSSDVVLTLISGGGSALLEAPRAPVTLADMQATTDLLLRAGAPIQDLNAVRSPLSLVKGGGLRRRMGAATCVSLILSDVLGSDPVTIASGPTVPSIPDPGRALRVLERWRIRDRVPPAVVASLEAAMQHPDDVMPETSRDALAIIADNDMLVDGVRRAGVQAGLHPQVSWRRQEGEARELGERFVAELESVVEGVDLVLGGGEATVTVRGDGVGGRNTEFALAAAIALDRTQGEWVIASLASDGEDGLVHGAGAIIDRHTVRRGAAMGLDARSALERNDSGGYFARTGELVDPGPTGTNVNDVYVALRARGTDGDVA